MRSRLERIASPYTDFIKDESEKAKEKGEKVDFGEIAKKWKEKNKGKKDEKKDEE